MTAVISDASRSALRGGVTPLIFLTFLTLAGCVEQHPDLKPTENLKRTENNFQQRSAQQSQEISVLRGQELPQLRGELERALHQVQELQGKQEDLKQRAGQIEQQTKKLEQLAGKIETDSSTRYAWIQKNLDGQELKHKEDRDRLESLIQESLNAQDVVIGTILLQMEKLEKRIQALEKR